MEQNIDIKENYIYQLDANLLAILLLDKSSGKNIIWATDNYAERGFGYQSSDQIMVDSITHRNGSVDFRCRGKLRASTGGNPKYSERAERTDLHGSVRSFLLRRKYHRRARGRNSCAVRGARHQPQTTPRRTGKAGRCGDADVKNFFIIFRAGIDKPY